MRAQRTIGAILAGVTTAGGVLTAHGTLSDTAMTYRAGFAALLIGLAGLVLHRQHCYVHRLMEHQAKLAVLSAQERQQYAEMGWRAAQLDASGGDVIGSAQVVHLPSTRPSAAHRQNGSA